MIRFHAPGYCARPIVVALACLVAVFPRIHGEVAMGATPPPNFWDAIPVSPSTTVPSEIKDDYWHGQFERVNREVAAARNTDLVFFGDSITWLWSLGSAKGLDTWNKEYARYHPINMGNSGDITPVMLYRVTHGNLDFPPGIQPRVAVLLCGTNNFGVTQSDGGKVRWKLGADCPPDEVADGVRAIAQVFRRRLPRTRVILLGILPVANATKWARCQQVNAINAKLACNPDEVVFLDLQDKFLRPDGSIESHLFADGAHPTAEGYRVWSEAIDPIVSKMMKAPRLEPQKIMLIGDSITEGADSSGAYRRYLDGMLRRKGLLIDFVGSRKKHNDNRTDPDNYEYDVDHEGHWGRDSKWLAEHLPPLIAENVPDVAVLHMGTEDIVSSAAEAGPLVDGIMVNIGKVVEELRSKNPRVKVVLAKIIPVPGKDDRVELLNRKISQFAQADDSSGSPIVVADLHAGFDVAGDLAPGSCLPSASGARRMAAVIAKAIDIP